MKFNKDQMLVCVSENGFLLKDMFQHGYPHDGVYYENLINNKVNGKFKSTLKKVFDNCKDGEYFIEVYNDAANRIPQKINKTKLYIIAHTWKDVGLSISTFYSNKKAVNFINKHTDDAFRKAGLHESAENLIQEYYKWVKEENDNICDNTITMNVHNIKKK